MKNFEKISKFFENFLESKNGLKWILRYKRALKSDFLLTSLFSPIKYGGWNTKISKFFSKIFQRYVSSIYICHVTGGGAGPPPYKNSHHRKTDFLLVKASFLVKFRQPERSSWVKLTGET